MAIHPSLRLVLVCLCLFSLTVQMLVHTRRSMVRGPFPVQSPRLISAPFAGLLSSVSDLLAFAPMHKVLDTLGIAHSNLHRRLRRNNPTLVPRAPCLTPFTPTRLDRHRITFLRPRARIQHRMERNGERANPARAIRAT
jgi:hypothetical protein